MTGREVGYGAGGFVAGVTAGLGGILALAYTVGRIFTLNTDEDTYPDDDDQEPQ